MEHEDQDGEEHPQASEIFGSPPLSNPDGPVRLDVPGETTPVNEVQQQEVVLEAAMPAAQRRQPKALRQEPPQLLSPDHSNVLWGDQSQSHQCRLRASEQSTQNGRGALSAYQGQHLDSTWLGAKGLVCVCVCVPSE